MLTLVRIRIQFWILKSIRWARAPLLSRVWCAQRSRCRVHVGERANCRPTCRDSPRSSSPNRNPRRHPVRRRSHLALLAWRPELSAPSLLCSLHSRAAPRSRSSRSASTTHKTRMQSKAAEGVLLHGRYCAQYSVQYWSLALHKLYLSYWWFVIELSSVLYETTNSYILQ